MKKMNINSKGFTLIELLAVITILGILMMVAIPNVTRTIENSRRDTFADVAQSYINSVRNSVLANELKCGSGSTITDVAATGKGTYYFAISTKQGDAAFQQTTDMMESGGKSSWGNADVHGYVVWKKSDTTRNGTTETKTVYSINLSDTGNHGTNGEVPDQQIKRTSIATSGKNAPLKPTDTGAVECKLA